MSLWGGLITQTVVLQRPDLVNAAIFIAGIGNSPVFGKIIGQAYLDLLENKRHPHIYIKSVNAYKFYPSASLGHTMKLFRQFWMFYQVLSLHSSDQNVLGHSTASCNWMKEDHMSELANLKAPALAIANEYDIYFPPSFVQKAVSKIPNAEYVEIKGTPHIAMNPEDRGKIISAVLDFLYRQTSRQ